MSKMLQFLFEKSPSSSKKAPALAQVIIDNSGNKLRFSGSKKGAFRIQRTDPELEVTAEELLSILKACNYDVLRMVPPNAAGAASGKFNTWFLKTKEGKNFSVVFGQGRNEGHKYEDQVLNDLQSSQQKQNSEDRSELYKALLQALNLQTDEIKQFRKTAEKHVKRPITDKIEDVGAIISDIDIILNDGRHIYISLKNENGLTFANSGYHGGFIVEMDKTVSSTFFTIKPGSHQLDDFVFALGIDKQKAADGINDYLQKRQTQGNYQKVPTQFDPEKIQNYLASAYGYGYWYVKPSRNGAYRIINLDSPEAAIHQVGNINSVMVTYPHYNSYTIQQKKRGVISNIEKTKTSKQITAWVDTTTATYVVELRNTKLGFNPNEIKVKIVAIKG